MSLNIKSIDRRAGGTSSNFIIDLPYQISDTYKILCLQIPNTVYSVITGVNDIVYTSLGNATLTQGSYIATTFVAMLQTQLIVVNAGFTATYNTDTKKITIANATPFTLNFATTTASAAKLCGFVNSNTNSGTSATGTLVIDLNYTSNLIINIEESKNKIASTDVQSNHRGSIYFPINVSFGSYQNLYFRDLPQTIDFPANTGKLTIKIFDSDGNTINLNGAEWNMLIDRMF